MSSVTFGGPRNRRACVGEEEECPARHPSIEAGDMGRCQIKSRANRLFREGGGSRLVVIMYKEPRPSECLRKFGDFGDFIE
jgi:hypothetical protein